jgi:hypothetical protein
MQIRIQWHILKADPDPVAHFECRSGSSGNEIATNEKINLTPKGQKCFYHLQCTSRYQPTRYTIVDIVLNLFPAKSYQNPDTHGSALICLHGSESALRQHAGSGTALKQMLIRKTGKNNDKNP